MTTVNINVHVKDDTKITASRVASDVKDFVSVKFDWDVNILIFTSEQAAALILAVEDAMTILKEIEGKDILDDMMVAGRNWIRSIYEDDRDYYRCISGWDLEDWEVVLKRSAYDIVPTKKLVKEFHNKFSEKGVN